MSSYDFLARRRRQRDNSERECLADWTDTTGKRVTCHNFQKHDQTKHGRIMKCKKCGNRECVQCNVVEHAGESCEQFQARLLLEHGDEENATAEAFKSGYSVVKVSESGKKPKKPRMAKPCPVCGLMIEREDGCGHMTCEYSNSTICTVNADSG